MAKNIFFVALIVAASGLIAPPLALLGGLLYGFAVEHPFRAESRRLAKFLLQASVIALGFGMNLHQVLQAGRSGFVYTALSITAAMLLGLALGHFFSVGTKSAFLISAGTAICGGSAIAAVGPAANASEEEMAVSLGTVFILNSVALFLFPWLGYRFRMSQEQFGLWSALAIHDTSSVVGAAARFGTAALAIATTIKLTRALWIVPLSFVTAGALKSEARVQWPWFILFFCLAAMLNTLLPGFRRPFANLNHLGTIGLTVTLFLIGTGLDRETLRTVGMRPLFQGSALWLILGVSTLLLIRLHWIHL
ncbi:MAG TPA: putative sulfate exporter family transporter [Terriglobia bacterium]|nr:putative sulfate exporter family transporter [Terriglobia bacterium]